MHIPHPSWKHWPTSADAILPTSIYIICFSCIFQIIWSQVKAPYIIIPGRCWFLSWPWLFREDCNLRKAFFWSASNGLPIVRIPAAAIRSSISRWLPGRQTYGIIQNGDSLLASQAPPPPFLSFRHSLPTIHDSFWGETTPHDREEDGSQLPCGRTPFIGRKWKKRKTFFETALEKSGHGAILTLYHSCAHSSVGRANDS